MLGLIYILFWQPREFHVRLFGACSFGYILQLTWHLGIVIQPFFQTCYVSDAGEHFEFVQQNYC